MTMSISDFIIGAVASHPIDLVKAVSRTFEINRQAAFKHVMKEVRRGTIIKVGRTRGTKYALPDANDISFSVTLKAGTAEEDVWNQHVKQRLLTLPENVFGICKYGFSEMFNNVIDHSEGRRAVCTIQFREGKVKLYVKDDGVGVFRKIERELHLGSIREAILHLSKGKVTTDPQRHSGQGIFFTSRAFDDFYILANGMYYRRFDENDWLLEHEKNSHATKGTTIKMEIDTGSDKQMQDVYRRYADADVDGFRKTVVAVALSANENDPHVSRSQAKRLLIGLEKFRHIVLDFKGVPSVGQAFVDEIFRVFQNQFPSIEITYVNANEDVEFMIRATLSEQS